LNQRVSDIDRLAELAALKIRVEPQHKFVEYARLLHQDLHAATAPPLSMMGATVDVDKLLRATTEAPAAAPCVMPRPPEIEILVDGRRCAAACARTVWALLCAA
jgi:hypothetical protein